LVPLLSLALPGNYIHVVSRLRVFAEQKLVASLQPASMLAIAVGGKADGFADLGFGVLLS
jgi:hypothetical protein